MGKTILIVEDEKSQSNALVDKFETDGFEVSHANNGNKGLEMALSSHPDVILLDIILPEMDGISMFKELRKDHWGKNAKVIFLTNLTDSDKVGAELKDETYNYLVKTDWRLEDVVKAVNGVIG